MKRVLAAMALTFAFSGAPGSAVAGSDDLERRLTEVWNASQVLHIRKDVREVTLPQPPSGPATPTPFCNPAAPICP